MPFASLSTEQIDQAEPREKSYRLADGGGLYIQVDPNGNKFWRYRYRINGRAKVLSIGRWPDRNCEMAREIHTEARALHSAGIDPSARKQMQKEGNAVADEFSFEDMARTWFSATSRDNGWSTKQGNKIIRQLEMYIFPQLGLKNVEVVSTSDIAKPLQRLVSEDKLDTARRVKRSIQQIFEFGHESGRMKANPPRMPDLKKLPTTSPNDSKPPSQQQLADILIAFHTYPGTFIILCAFRLAPHVLMHPAELWRAKNAEIEDIDGPYPQWCIPYERAKRNKSPEYIPLSKSAVAILRQLRELTGIGEYIFPGARDSNAPMNKNTIQNALKSMGYSSDTAFAQKFRSAFRALLVQQGYQSGLIECQLSLLAAHREREVLTPDQDLPKRLEMMQAWGEWLDSLLEHGAKV